MTKNCQNLKQSQIKKDLKEKTQHVLTLNSDDVDAVGVCWHHNLHIDDVALLMANFIHGNAVKMAVLKHDATV